MAKKNKYIELLKAERVRKMGKVIEKEEKIDGGTSLKDLDKKEGEDNASKTEPVKKKAKTTPKKTKKKKK